MSPISILCLWFAIAFSAFGSAPRQQILFDDDWQFHLGEVTGAQHTNVPLTNWNRLNLPHDWSAQAGFSQTNASCTAYLPGGIGWYRKTFKTASDWAGRKVLLTFDGVYRNAEVWVNGHSLGQRPYGYSTFQYDLTPFLYPKGRNVLAVRVERTNVADSRFYPGTGIYRHVWLTVCDKIHVPLWGTYITTPRASDESADVIARTEVTNETANACFVVVKWQVERQGQRAGDQQSDSRRLRPSECYTFSTWQKVARPALWSPDSPELYTMVARVFVDGALKDEVRTPFGIRTFYFDANHGFFINGKNMKIKGVCIHQDAGVLGVAVPEDVLLRRLRLLKGIGANAIRCAHNPMAPELYDMCDRLGLMVMDEAFDEWEIGKRKWVQGRNIGFAGRFGYSSVFADWAERDCADMVRRDRNHPSIIFWSIGNEIDYPTDPYVLSETRTVEGFGNDNNEPQQTRLAVVAPKLIATVKRQDPTRPVTMALANVVSSDATGLAQMLDVVGYNYQEAAYEADHRQFPARIIYGSENGTGLPEWKAVTDNPFIAGQFLWVGFDFLGEAGEWPSHGSRSGLFDTRGFKKIGAVFRQALWTDAPIVALYVSSPPLPAEDRERRRRLQPSWTWPEHTGKLRVIAISNCEKIDLRLNDRLVESNPIDEQRSATFDIDYQPGVLTAVALRRGQPVATNTLATAGDPVAIRLEPDRNFLPADGRSVCHITASLVDQHGNLVYSAENPITTKLKGGRLLGVDNGDLADTTPLSSPTKQAHGGQVLMLVQSQQNSRELKVSVTSPGLPPATLRLRTRPQK